MPIDLADIQTAMANGRANDRLQKAKRMAGNDRVEQLLAELKPIAEAERRLDELEADARVYLNRQYGIEDQFIAAGLTPRQARMVEALEELKGRGVPSAFIHSPMAGVEERVHTRYGKNPLTGQQEIVPYLDPGTGNVLVTNYGDSRTGNIDMAGYGKGSEYVQDRAMRLMGQNPIRNNNSNVTDVDFLVNGKGIDGEIREDFEAKNRNVPVQLYTLTTTPETKGGNKRVVASAVDRVIRDELRKRGGNAIDATERAYQSRRLEDAIPGKLAKTESIPQLLMTTLRSQDAIANKATKDKLAIAPREVRVVDMKAAKDYVEGMTAEQTLRGTGGRAALQVRPNDGDPYSRNREGRGRVYIRVPENTPGVSYDAAQRFPHVAQLY